MAIRTAPLVNGLVLEFFSTNLKFVTMPIYAFETVLHVRANNIAVCEHAQGAVGAHPKTVNK